MMKLNHIVAAGSALAAQSFAQSFSQQCYSDICYTLNIPEETSRSGNGNVYFQISGPTSYSWIGLGQGSQMAGSNIFVIYEDGNGNVTLSARHGAGHFEPEPDSSANVTLLEGSGVQGGKMVANVVCSNCNSWNGGSTDFTSTSGSWIHASRPGDPLDSTDVDEELEEHDDHGSFRWQYTKAQGGQDINPFVSRAQPTGVSSPPQASGVSENSGSTDDDDDGEASDMIVSAHGTIASVVFLVLLPVGAIVLRLLNLSAWVHASIQIFAYCCFIAAAGLGIYIATTEDLLTDHHPIIGLVLLGLLTIQPFAGVIHHNTYRKTQRRTFMSYVHIWNGRIIIILGIINGGLGIMLAGDVKRGYIIAYGVVAGAMGLAYLVAAVFGETTRQKKPSTGEDYEPKD